jgi:hypothetical protein
MFEWRLVTGCCLSGEGAVRQRATEVTSQDGALGDDGGELRRARRVMDGSTTWHHWLRIGRFAPRV